MVTPRADFPDAQRWFALEERLYGSQAYESRVGSSTDTAEFDDFRRGGVCFVAIHSVMHWSWTGASKLADRGTGSLVEVLVSAVPSRGLVLAKRPESLSQLTGIVSRLSSTCASQGGVVIDLHGMRNQRDLDAEIGLGISPSVAEVETAQTLVELLSVRGLRVAVNEVFKAPVAWNVTNSVRASGGSAFQLEIAACARPPIGDPARSQGLFDALCDFAKGHSGG